jgi:DNA repair protein RadD
MLRPTQSPVLHVQSIGRGLRVVYADGHDVSTKEGRLAAIKAGPKQNCLVLDFAGNTARLGPINNVQVKKKGKGLEGGEPITKECPDCATIVHPSVKQCPVCGHEFKFEVKIGAVASTEELIAKSTRNWYDVSDVFYYHHKTHDGDINMLKVVYQCGLKTFTEYVGVEHMGYAKHKADRWLKQRAIGDIGNARDSVAILLTKTDMLIKPKQIRVDTAGKFAQVLEWR